MKRRYTWRKPQVKLFWYWINTRHRIYLKKKAGEPWPWTKDKILQTYRFTNVFRQLDRVTEEWVRRYVTLLHRGKDLKMGDVIFQCCMFRLFNWPETYDALYYGMRKWNLKKAIEILAKRQTEDFEQIFTGAYIIPTGGKGVPKIEVICEVLDQIWKDRHDLARRIRKKPRMERTVRILSKYPTIGGFIAYEIACDLRHTRILYDASDVRSWANPGPGAQRGIHRLLTGTRHHYGNKPDYVLAMRQLLREAPDHIEQHVKSCEWPFEMREIEHSLREFDKYMRAKNGEGKPRSLYRYKEKVDVPWFDDED
jgi:hypothetical protein